MYIRTTLILDFKMTVKDIGNQTMWHENELNITIKPSYIHLLQVLHIKSTSER